MLTVTGGSHHLTAHAFSRPQSGLARLLPTLWAAPSIQPEAGNINAIAMGVQVQDARDLWAIVDMRIQRWSMSDQGWEELISERDVAIITRQAIRETFDSASPDDAELDLELLDLKIER